MEKTKRIREPRNYRILAGAIIVAALFWFAVTMGGSFVAQYNIPLTVTNLPEDVALRASVVTAVPAGKTPTTVGARHPGDPEMSFQ